MSYRHAVVFVILLFFGACAVENEPSYSEEGGLSILWGGLSPTCIDSATFNDANEGEVTTLQFDDGPPADIDRLVLLLTEKDCTGACTTQSIFPLDKISLTSGGILEVTKVPSGVAQSLLVLGCKGDEAAPRWTGRNSEILVEEHSKQTAFVLMTPETKLSCATDGVQIGATKLGSSAPFESGNTSFSGVAQMTNGDVALVGGFDSSLAATSHLSLLDSETGTWLERPDALASARGMASVYPLDARNVLVFGGSPRLEINRGLQQPPFLFPGSEAEGFSTDEFIEIIDIVEGESTSVSLPGAAVAGIQSFPVLASTQYVPAQDNILVVGGVNNKVAGKDFANESAVSDLLMRINGLRSPSQEVTVRTLVTPRIGAALMPTVDGHLIIFGGNYDGDEENLIEWVSNDWQHNQIISSEDISFEGSLTIDDIQTVGFASSILVKDEPDDRTWLVIGGQTSFGSGYGPKIENGQILSVNVVSGSSDAPTITIHKVSANEAELGTRAFAHLSHLSGGRILMVGGIASVGPVLLGDECLTTDGQCLRKNAIILSYNDTNKTLSVNDEISIGPALGVGAVERADGTIALSPGLNNIQTNEVDAGLPSLLWNPLSSFETGLCGL